MTTQKFSILDFRTNKTNGFNLCILRNGEITLASEYVNGLERFYFYIKCEKSMKNLKELFEGAVDFEQMTGFISLRIDAEDLRGIDFVHNNE